MNEVFLFVLMCLAAYRATRFFVADTWPPVATARAWLIKTTGYENPWSDIWTCPYCFGFWVSWIVVGVIEYFTSVRFPGLQGLAVSGVVGLLSKWEG